MGESVPQTLEEAMREIERLRNVVDYFETGCTCCGRNYKHLEKGGNA